MIEFTALSGPVQALLVVGVVFVQALVLYVGYSALERITLPLIERATGT